MVEEQHPKYFRIVKCALIHKHFPYHAAVRCVRIFNLRQRIRMLRCSHDDSPMKRAVLRACPSRLVDVELRQVFVIRRVARIGRQ
jgi:hypothetical protein